MNSTLTTTESNADAMNTRLHTPEHHFETLQTRIDALSKSHSKQKKQCLALAVINVILIVCAIAAIMTTMICNRSQCNNEPVKPLPKSDVCVSCSRLSLLIPDQHKWKNVYISEDRCCFQNLLALEATFYTDADEKRRQIHNSLKILRTKVEKLDTYGRIPSNWSGQGEGNFTQQQIRILQNKLYGLETVINAMSRGKDLIYLKNDGTFTKAEKGFNFIKWIKRDERFGSQGSISLTYSRGSIKVDKDGYYYLYSRVRFRRQVDNNPHGSVSLIFYIMSSRQGTIEQSNQTCMFRNGTLEHESTIQTIYYLRKGDLISVIFPHSQLEFVIPDTDSHTLGMFEL